MSEGYYAPRYRIEPRPRPFMERLRIWFYTIKDAICDFPEATTSKYVEVKPDDPGYENAPFSFQIIGTPLRFDYVDGEYRKRVE